MLLERISRLGVLILVAAALVLPATPTASAQSLQLPCRFYGLVFLDCLPAPDGTLVTAVIDGDTYTTTTPAEYGSSTYGLKIAPPEGKFYSDGTQITFRIDDLNARQTAAWEAGGNIELDLADACIPATHTVTYVSDTSNLVALSTDGVNYRPKQNAVATWLFQYWPKISGATWVSTAYTVEDAVHDSWRKFERSFTVPDDATNLSAAIQIAADDSCQVYLNGVEIGGPGVPLTLETRALPPATGHNTLQVVVRNYGHRGASPTTNPTGLVYKLTVKYDLPPTATPSPTPTPTAAVTPTPTPTPPPTTMPTPTQPPTPTPSQANSGFSVGKAIGLAIFGIVDIALIVLLVYLVWRFYVQPKRQA